ncbi:hypothetical protein ACFSFW_20575 [Fredinandcohnia salidurans]|uniref:Uncharacterized protein n=1 Tax=Fredinandcohnia salidurans TaxID=2595041 RepID=A0ABW4MSX0_9BACI
MCKASGPDPHRTKALVHWGSGPAFTEKDLFATIGQLSIDEKEIESSDTKRIVCVPIGTGALDMTYLFFTVFPQSMMFVGLALFLMETICEQEN